MTEDITCSGWLLISARAHACVIVCGCEGLHERTSACVCIRFVRTLRVYQHMNPVTMVNVGYHRGTNVKYHSSRIRGDNLGIALKCGITNTYCALLTPFSSNLCLTAGSSWS